jgi:hypothetical protein
MDHLQADLRSRGPPPRPTARDDYQTRGLDMKTKAPMRFRTLLRLIPTLALLGGCSGGDDNNAKAKDGVQEIRASIFDSDPTLQDADHDGVKDWVIRDRESEHLDEDPKISIEKGVVHSANGDPIDSRPRMDFPDHTELLWSARAVSNDEIEPYEQGQYYGDWDFPGAMTWINFDYDVANAQWAGVFTVVYKYGDEQILYVMNQVDAAEGSTNKLGYKCVYVQRGLPLDEFVDVKVHLYITEHKVGITVNGKDQGKVAYQIKHEAEPKDDRFVTLFVPQGVAEWRSLSLQVAAP